MITPFAINDFVFSCNFGQYNGIRLFPEVFVRAKKNVFYENCIQDSLACLFETLSPIT